MTYLMSLIFKVGPDRSLPGRKKASSLLANGVGMYDNDTTSYDDEFIYCILRKKLE